MMTRRIPLELTVFPNLQIWPELPLASPSPPPRNLLFRIRRPTQDRGAERSSHQPGTRSWHSTQQQLAKPKADLKTAQDEPGQGEGG